MDARAILLSLVSLGFSVTLSTLHLALADLSRGMLEELAQQRALKHGGGDTGGLRRIRKILADVNGHSRAMGMARVACNLAFAGGVVWTVASIKTSWGSGGEEIGQPILTLTDVLIGTGVAMAVLWVVSVALAESLARHAGERLVYACSPLVRLVHSLLYPLKPMAAAIDSAVQRAFGRDKEDEQAEFEAELMSVVEEGEREGQVDEAERNMIEAVVEMKDLTVEQIMTPRTELEALALTDNLGEVTAFVRKATHSRIPVYRGNLDDVVGIFYVKDLLHWLAGATQLPGNSTPLPPPAPRPADPAAAKGKHPRAFSLLQIVRPAMFVPETKTVRETLVEMLQKKVHIAVVADEYGGTAGVVALEDIVECVFGEIQDEYELPEDEPPRIEVKLHPASETSPRESEPAPAALPNHAAPAALGGTADADARAYIDDVNDALEPLGVTLPEGDEYDTLGGFVLAHLGRIPLEGDEFVHDRVKVRVIEATPTRVLRVRLEVSPEQTAATPSRGDDAAVEKAEPANHNATAK